MGRPRFRPPPAPSEASPEPALIARLVDFVGDLPNESDERPAKRARPSGSVESVTVARHTLQFNLQSSNYCAVSTHIVRKNVGEHLRVGCSEPLRLTPRKKSKGASFDILLSLDLRSNKISAPDSDSMKTTLMVAWEQSVNPGVEASIWASVDVDIAQTGHNVDISLSFSLEWIASRSMAKYNTMSQIYLRRAVMLHCLQNLDLPSKKQLSSKLDLQEFYEAVFVPERDQPGLDLPSGDINGLSATLYPFQRKSVQWLLTREGVKWTGSNSSDDNKQVILEPYEPDTSKLPLSFSAQQDVSGRSVAVSPLFGRLVRDPAPFHSFQNVRGGILAEEMGLGKTLEVISLILLHQRPEEQELVFDQYLGRHIRPTKGTLIVTPPSLCDQWLSELARHAPGLRVMHYSGLKDGRKFYEEAVAQKLVEKLAQHDVVIVTYDVLRSEIHVAVDPPSRSMRKPKIYKRAVCPLVQLSWWRVCIDEAQMVENWKSDTALMARLIPRVNAWAITGTPVKSSVQEDLRGLLAFLRFEPYASEDDVWKAFSTHYRDVFRQVFNLICLRHTKSEVRKELELPSQKRYVISMPFSAVEEQHYQSTFKHLVRDCGLDVAGAPLTEHWNPDNPGVQQSMRLALDRLRQMVLHPQIKGMAHSFPGSRARNRPLRTVAEVLDAMIEQSEAAIRTDQRALLLRKLQRGQVLAMLGKPKDALALWQQVKRDSTAHVAECRDELQKELGTAQSTAEREQASSDEEVEDAGDGTVSQRLSEARRRLRHALEIQHRAVFFCGNAYYSIKTDESVTEPGSENFKRLEQLEVESYDLAKTIRKEILHDTQTKAKKLMEKIEYNAHYQKFAVIPGMEPMQRYGIESRRAAEASEALCGFLDEQAGVIDDWREHVIELLLQPLLDEESEEVTGEEFEESTKLADEIAACVQALRTVLADRHLYLSGQKNQLIEHEYKVAKRSAERGEGPCPEKMLELFAVRDELIPNPVADLRGEFGSIRGIVTALRGLASKLGPRGQSSADQRVSTELSIVTRELTMAQKQLSEQMKAVTMMEQEATLFSDTMNARIDFYRQLQAVSDMVADYEGGASEDAYAGMMRQEELIERALSAAEAKHRYLVHLKEAESALDEKRLCVICQESFSVGVLTICGHQFCKECLTMWFNAHRTCPICKRKLTKDNLHDITLKPQELKLHAENDAVTGARQNSPSKKTSIYSELNPERLAEIKNIDLDGPNYTTKVDTLVRHLIWLREFDPGTKSIVFSQYQNFLSILESAFDRYRIGYASITEKDGTKRFKEDPGIEVFLLHARAHSSGLNLVNASHVFLCEPILNTALELQAIARVDRIGQEHETTVWLYLVEGTVEESIYNLSAERRLEHMGRNLKGKSTRSTPELLDANIEQANSMELQQASLSKLMGKGDIAGEAVDKQDLWKCLFGHVQLAAERRSQERLKNNPTVRGFLAAEAAEARMAGEEEGVAEQAS